MGTQATVLSVNKDGSLQLQAGILKITARQEEVRVVEGETQQSAKKVVARAEHKLRTLGASPEVDLRGMMTDEAIGAFDLFLDNAVLGKLNEVRVIHGKGTGAVRSAGAPQAQPLRQVLPPRPLRRRRGRCDHRRASVEQVGSGLRGNRFPPEGAAGAAANSAASAP